MIQLYLNGTLTYEREVAMSDYELSAIKKMSFYDRVKYREQLVNAHCEDMKGKYWRIIAKANRYRIVAVMESKMNKKV